MRHQESYSETPKVNWRAASIGISIGAGIASVVAFAQWRYDNRPAPETIEAAVVVPDSTNIAANDAYNWSDRDSILFAPRVPYTIQAGDRMREYAKCEGIALYEIADFSWYKRIVSNDSITESARVFPDEINELKNYVGETVGLVDANLNDAVGLDSLGNCNEPKK